MPAHESLRIRTPPPDSPEDECDEQVKKSADIKARNIPTIIMTIALGNLLIYLYSSNETNLYFAIASLFIWAMFLRDAIYDINALNRMRHLTIEMESGV
jgi:hypothetical protein